MNTNSAHPDCVFCEKELTISILKNILKNGHSYDLYECDTCEIAMLHPFPSEEELSKLCFCENYRTGAVPVLAVLLSRLLVEGLWKSYQIISLIY